VKDPERLLPQLSASPRDPKIDARRKRFHDINAYIAEHGGWMTSIPGDRQMRFIALVGSPLPAQLRDVGYVVTKIGESQRIDPHTMGIVAVEMYDLGAAIQNLAID
jgi:hypothetical protein